MIYARRRDGSVTEIAADVLPADLSTRPAIQIVYSDDKSAKCLHLFNTGSWKIDISHGSLNAYFFELFELKDFRGERRHFGSHKISRVLEVIDSAQDWPEWDQIQLRVQLQEELDQAKADNTSFFGIIGELRQDIDALRRKENEYIRTLLAISEVNNRGGEGSRRQVRDLIGVVFCLKCSSYKKDCTC